MRLLFLQHDPLDSPGALLEWADERDHSFSICLISSGELLPSLETFDLLISLGGPMGAYEEEKYPWLVQEKQFLRDALAAGKRILGLCLGCQLLADAFGGKVFRHSCKEFGWQPIEPTAVGQSWFPLTPTEKTFLAFQWHGDTYSLPPGAIQLARNTICEEQAFLLGKQVMGLQFHLEWTEPMMHTALAEPGVAPPTSTSVQTPTEILSNLSFLESSKERLFTLMDRFTI
jgi:GMP synthase-like glutamine amidotransferase